MAKAAAKPAAPAVKKSSARKVMITCAVTGAIHTPSMSPHLPVTPEEIAEASVGAHEAGAALVIGIRRKTGPEKYDSLDLN